MIVVLSGCFYLEGGVLVSHQYQLSVGGAGQVRLQVEGRARHRPGPRPQPDLELYLFTESQRFVGRTVGGVWEGGLGPGKYTVVPWTSGARLTPAHHSSKAVQEEAAIPLVALGPDSAVELSPQFRRALTDLFSQADLDSSGGLSREEFTLFNWRTSGEQVTSPTRQVPLEEGLSHISAMICVR